MGVVMRGDDGICGSLFSYIDIETRVRSDHPLRAIRQIANAALKSLSGEFAKLYSPIGRESIPPERLMRRIAARRAFYSIRRVAAIGRADPLRFVGSLVCRAHQGPLQRLSTLYPFPVPRPGSQQATSSAVFQQPASG